MSPGCLGLFSIFSDRDTQDDFGLRRRETFPFLLVFLPDVSRLVTKEGDQAIHLTPQESWPPLV